MLCLEHPERLALAAPAQHPDRPTLRFITCGSVDDGKSTLVGRLLYDSKLLLDDQLSALHAESKSAGATGHDLDFALLVDGLQAERAQGITIDVAYRFFATPQRRFVVADTPGHVQYTRNMATGASTADLAVVLIDARKGVIDQTRRHSHIVGLFGIRHVVLAVNKMDLVGFDAARFIAITHAYRALATELGITDVCYVPVVAPDGDNIFTPSARMPWYSGPTIMQHLQAVDVGGEIRERPFRMPVQWVNRPNAEFRGFCGRIASGRVARGDAIIVQPSNRRSHIARILTPAGERDVAVAGQSVTLLFADEVDVSRGDVLSSGEAARVSDRLAAHLLWFDDAALQPGRRYLLKSARSCIGAVISALQHRVAIDSMAQHAATTLNTNEIGAVELRLERPLVCETYRDDRELGSFILIDPLSHNTAAAGVIDAALRCAGTVGASVDAAPRAYRTQPRGYTLWLNGGGDAASPIARLVERQLGDLGRPCTWLDAEALRHGLNRDLGTGDAARAEAIRRLAEIAKLFAAAGLTVLVTPPNSASAPPRALFEPGALVAIDITVSPEPRKRPSRQLDRRPSERGSLTVVAEPAQQSDLVLIELSPDAGCVRIVAYLRDHGLI
ncbi:MAG TPA: bifunctional sulfate adenylyltransferase subunit 1/adenylylsulfate kinase [Rhodopseudomonas sp.]|uniref:bifunctional sulfate adenylyltransferase subunit 1/adenylylsulfate kinase n=1 Tax=Rhodopseudomonas sp. TaxID=1078 RepID=UPI002ED9B4A9